MTYTDIIFMVTVGCILYLWIDGMVRQAQREKEQQDEY